MRWMLTPETVVGRVGPEDEEEADGTTDQRQGLGQPLARGLADEPGGKERVEAHEMREGDQEAPCCEGRGPRSAVARLHLRERCASRLATFLGRTAVRSSRRLEHRLRVPMASPTFM